MSTTATVATGKTGSGSIYDLGYRHYTGTRRGRLWSVWSLFVESTRGVWGFGRPMTAKAAPFILAGLYALPAVVQLAFSSTIANAIATEGAGNVNLLAYHSYFGSFFFLVFFFCVAQAPELVCRDQRYKVLPLYFTRPMGRVDYIVAKLGSLTLSLFILLSLPSIALFVGDVLMKPDTFKAIGDELPKALPSIPANALIAVGLSALCLAVSSFSARRAYSAIAILAYILLAEAVPAAVYAIGKQSDWTWADKLSFISPITALSGAAEWFFGHVLDPEQFPITLSSDQYVLASIAGAVLFATILIVRYRRIPA